MVLTGDGEALLGHARQMLSIEGEVQQLFAGNSLRGSLRLGVSEDFVTSQLPDVLEEFVRSHPSVDLELTVALSGTLYEMQDNGELDLVLAKRRLGDVRGKLVYREPLVWLARDPGAHSHACGTPAADRLSSRRASPAPWHWKRLRRQQVPWRIVCTCGSLSGLTAAARAGMGVLVQPRSMAPAGLSEIAPGWLPALEDVEFVLVPRKGADQLLVSALSEDILAKVRGLRSS